MDIVKKRIEKYFQADYLLDERQTFQGQRKKQASMDRQATTQDVLLRTIRLTDNIFALKDKLPEPSYDGKTQRNRGSQSANVQQPDVVQKDDNDLQKMETLIPLSYISPLQKKKASQASQPNLSLIDQLNLDDPPTLQKSNEPLKEVKPNIKLAKSYKVQPDQSRRISTLIADQQVNDYTSQTEVKSVSRKYDYSSSKSTLFVNSLGQKPHHAYESQSQDLKSSVSQKLILPTIQHLPKVDTVLSSIDHAASAKSLKVGKNGLLINVNNVLKNETVPLSYLKGKSIVMRDVSKSPLNSRIMKSNDSHKPGNMILPELRGMSLESYKYVQDNNQYGVLNPNQRYVQQNLNHLRSQVKAQSQENGKKLKNLLIEKRLLTIANANDNVQSNDGNIKL